MRHHAITGVDAWHPFAFVGATDPALDADNDVAAGKAWIDDTEPDDAKLYYRNDSNTAWVRIGGA